MDYQNNETYNIIIRVALLLLGFILWGFRWAIANIQRIGERLSKIEGTCKEREKTVYKKEADQEEGQDPSRYN